jgi:serine/threonine protein phosphatase PrpC
MKSLYDPSWKIQLSISSAQLQGQRARQEDSFLTRFRSDRVTVTLGDGLGGHGHGDAASYIACETALQRVNRAPLDVVPNRINGTLHKAFVAAHRAVSSIKMTEGRSYQPATTLVAGLFLPKTAQLFSAYIGDSTFLLLRDGHLEYLFQPQGAAGWVAFCIGGDIGDYGSQRGSAIECLKSPLALKPGDKYLLASDGVEELSLAEISTCLARPARVACEAMVQLLIQKNAPGQDNTTLVVVEVQAPPEVTQ